MHRVSSVVAGLCGIVNGELFIILAYRGLLSLNTVNSHYLRLVGHHACVWLCVDDGFLRDAVAVGARTCANAAVATRVKDGEQKITVVASAPSPVHVIEAILVVTIDDEGMTAFHCRACVIDRAAVCQLVIDEAVPFGGFEIVAVYELCCCVVVEI